MPSVEKKLGETLLLRSRLRPLSQGYWWSSRKRSVLSDQPVPGRSSTTAADVTPGRTWRRASSSR